MVSPSIQIPQLIQGSPTYLRVSKDGMGDGKINYYMIPVSLSK